MAAISTRSAPLAKGARGLGTSSEGDDADGRRLRPRRGLPGGRAVVGGLLVAVAAVGIFAAVSGAGRGPSTRYYVAADDLAAGTVLTSGDLEPVAIEVPERLRDRVFTDPDALIGAVVVGPLSEGELIQAGGLASGTDAEVPTFSVSLARADANAGELSRGDFVQVLATYGADTSATTITLSTDARIVSISDGEDSIAASGQVVVRLQVPDAQQRAAIVNATVAGRLSLIRVSGADDVTSADRFRPDLDPDTAASGTDEEEPGATTEPADAEGDGG